MKWAIDAGSCLNKKLEAKSKGVFFNTVHIFVFYKYPQKKQKYTKKRLGLGVRPQEKRLLCFTNKSGLNHRGVESSTYVH